jgi:N-methylhydantoinase A
VTRERAAHAVHEIVSASMASAVHVVTVQRGIDPRGFVLVALGGAGPMHAARVAGRFGIGTVVVPAYCGVASAAGLLAGELSTERVLSRLDAGDPAEVFAELAAEAAGDLGVSSGGDGVRVSRSVDVRFLGQSHDLTVEWSDDRPVLESRFFDRYEQVYGIRQRGEIELVGYRVRVTLGAPPADLAPPAPAEAGQVAGSRSAYFAELGGYTDVPVRTRDGLAPAEGPLIIEDAESTIVVPPGWTAVPGPAGAVHLRKEDA